MYLDPEVKQEAEDYLERKLPDPKSTGFADAVIEIRLENPDLAERIMAARIPEGQGDARDDDLKAEARRARRQKWFQRAFMKEDEYDDEPILHKRKVAAWAISAGLIGLLFFNFPPTTWPVFSADTVGEEAITTVVAPEIEAGDSEAHETGETNEPESSEAEQDEPLETRDEVLSEIRETFADVEPEGVTPPDSIEDPATETTGSTMAQTQTTGVTGPNTAGTSGASGYTPLEEYAPSALVSLSSREAQSALITERVTGRATIIVNERPARSALVSTRPAEVGLVTNTPATTSSSVTAQEPPPTLASAVLRTDTVPTVVERSETQASQPTVEPDGTPDQSPPVVAAPPVFAQTSGLPYTPGQTVEGELDYGILTTEGSAVPAVVRTDEGIWKGLASVNALGRIEVELNEFILDGESFPTEAFVLGEDDFPGVVADVRDETPALAAKLVKSGLRGVTNYVKELSSLRTAVVDNQVIVLNDQPVPLEWAVTGSLAELFTPPESEQAFVSVASLDAGTPVKVKILQ